MPLPNCVVAAKVISVCVLILTVLALPAFAVAADDLDTRQQQAFRDAVLRVAPSVVRIETVGGADEIGDLAVGTGPTTGLVVDAQGYIASSSINFAHRPSGILVRLPDGTRLAAKLVATDHRLKVALLKVEAEAEPAVPQFVPGKELRIGQWAVAVGRAFDATMPNMAVGIVSALDRVWGKALQTDAAVSPNNYGGPLIDVRGRVLGLLVPMSPGADNEVAGVKWYDSGIGFAVPADDLLAAVGRLKAGEDLHAGLLGISLPKRAEMTGRAVVAGVLPNSPAEKGGLKKGDVIVRIDDRNIVRAAELKSRLAQRYAGDTVRILARRGEETVECDVTLAAKLAPYQCPLLGILPERSSEQEGVEVRLVLAGTPAERAGLKPRDIVKSLDGEAVANAHDLRTDLARRKVEDTIVLEVVCQAGQEEIKLALGQSQFDLPDSVPARPGDPEAKAGQVVTLELPQWKNKTHVYVPKGYDRSSPAGLLLWLSRPGADPADLFEIWKTRADARGLIVVVPEPSVPGRWLPRESEMVRDFLRLALKRYAVDPLRVAVGGQQGGGSLAYQVAMSDRETVRGLVVVDGAMQGPLAGDHPVERLSILVGRSANGRFASRIDRAVALLRERLIPVTMLPCGKEPGPLSGRDADAIVRWMECLDRI